MEEASSSRRRPVRTGRPNKRYTIDPFEQYRDLLLEPDSDLEGRPLSVHAPVEDEASDDDFDEAAAAAEEAEAEVEEDDVASEVMSNSAESDNGEQAVPGAVEEPEDDQDDEQSHETVTVSGPAVKLTMKPASAPKKLPNKKRMENFSYNTLPIFDPMGSTGAKGRNIHFSRGVPEAVHTQGRNERLIYSVGPDEEDLIAHVKVRDRWLNDATVPYRKANLIDGKLESDQSGGGLAYSSWYPEEKRRREANEEMSWYYEDGGRETFEAQQFLDHKVHEDFAPNNYTDGESIVAGPTDSQKLYPGPKVSEAWNMGEAYASTRAAEHNQAWILNAGARVSALEWAPNQNGPAQYVAVTTSYSPSELPVDENDTAPAYTPQARRQQCLQIWEVYSKGAKGDAGSRIDFTKQPRLRQVFSTDWGHIKKMRWCPIPDRTGDASTRTRLGFLAAIFSDGYLRVFDMATPASKSKNVVQYIHIWKAAFQSKPPEAVCTCLAWLSSKNIVAGISDGSIAIWTIPDCLNEMSGAEAKDANAIPWLNVRLHQAYVNSVTSGYPSRPHLLVTHSLDGLLRLTDLRSPSLDTVVSQRSRIAQGPVVWHDISQSALNIDDNFTMKSYGARMFYKAISVARMTGFGSDVSVSNLHASVLTGCVDGTVWVSNPLRRLRDHKFRPLVQCVLKHEWRRPLEPLNPTRTNVVAGEETRLDVEMDVDPDPNPILSKPLLRLTTGFKIQPSDMGQESRANATKDFVSFATVHEEKTAVTQVSWNPNLIAGTWAAVGMGSGLVVIKDLAHE